MLESGRPGKIVAVHLNYRSRAAQRGRTPASPSYFLKPSSSLAASGDDVERPAGTELLAFEGEIALIIGRRTRRVAPDDGWAAVSGVTASNDLGVYDLRAADKGSNLRSKGGDGFTPVGPTVIPADSIDPAALRVRTWVNGELVQQATTDELLFPFGQLIADLSQLMTLEPGDLILTGTPAGSSVVVPGDVVEVEVDAPSSPDTPSSGRLITRVVSGSVPFGDYGTRPSVDETQRAEAFGERPAGAETVSEATAFGLTDELRARLASVSTATLSSQLRKRGMTDVFIDGLAPTHPRTPLIGTARTLRYLPYRDDLFQTHGNGYNAQKRAFDSLESGDVLVIEARGVRDSGTLGDVLALRAQVNGAAGIVTDGGVRDLEVVASLDIPVYHSGAHPAVLGRRHVPWDTDVTIACGGATIQPGDVIVGDADGLLVIPPHLVESVVTDALEQEREETFIAEQVAAGEKIDGLFPMNEQWRERYGVWLSHR